jgi:hypothetical protein
MLSVLATDTHCVTALALILKHLLNNTMPPAVRTLLTTTRLVSLVKDDRGGRRPVAVGEMLYRLASRYALFRVIDHAQRLLAPQQFGVGEQDGCSQVVQSLQHLLTLPPKPVPSAAPRHYFAFSSPRPAPVPGDTIPRPLACLSIDMANAFNSINRAALLQAAYSQPELSPCWRMVAFAYGQPSLLLMSQDSAGADDTAYLLSENGVRQGDPLSSLLFSLAMRKVYSHIAAQLQAGCYAFIDDSHGVGYLSQCWRVWQQLPELLEPLGLQLNVDKCELTCFHMTTDAQVAGLHSDDRRALRAFTAAGLTINTSCMRVLGCVVGATDAVVAEELRSNIKFRADQRAAFHRLRLLTKQTGMIALRHLTGTVLTHRLRAMTPASTAAHAAEYDECVLKAAHRLVGITPSHGDTYDYQLRWPLRIGGFGLTSAVEIAPAAYIAGLSCTLCKAPAFAALYSSDDELDPSWPLHTAVADSIARVAAIEAPLIAQCPPTLIANISASVLPTSADTFVAHTRALSSSCLIQSAVSHRISTLSHIARVRQAGQCGKSGEAELARLHSLNCEKAKESSLWLQVMPTSPHLRLPNCKWQWAAQLRLGMAVPVYEASEHSGRGVCSHTAAAATNGWHPLTCITSMGAEITRRHNVVLSRIAHFARLLGVTPRVEPAGLHSDDRRRPDIQLDLPEVTLLGDVTISHPLAKSWQKVAASARGVEAVGDAREAEKNDLYADMAKECEMEFGAIVLYTYGGFHASALTFIQRMAKAVDPATCLTSPSRWRRELMEHIAIAVQRGNAEIMITAAQRLRGKAWGGRRRRLRSVPYPSEPSLSSKQGQRGARNSRGASDSDKERQQLSDRSRAMRSVARLIGLSAREAACDELTICLTVDSDADTEMQDEDESTLPSSPSFIAETPLSRDSGRSGWEEGVRMSAPQSEEMKERGASVSAESDAVSDRQDAARSECATGVVVAAVETAVVSSDRMDVEEQEVLDGVCEVMAECVGGGAGVRVVGV